MANELTADQRLLADYMSELSEEAFFAGWMTGLEYALWMAVTGHLEEYGYLKITEAHRTRLRDLSDACRGWIYFDDEIGETWISISDWEQRFAEDLRRPSIR
jgi:hypothetical protein